MCSTHSALESQPRAVCSCSSGSTHFGAIFVVSARRSMDGV